MMENVEGTAGFDTIVRQMGRTWRAAARSSAGVRKCFRVVMG
jgi:hypothetical protein